METFDITLFDEQDQVLLEIEGFTMRRIDDPAKATERCWAAHDAALSGGEQPIEIADHHGITPLDGARALTRMLMAKTPAAVVAVAQPLEELDAQRPPRRGLLPPHRHCRTAD